MTNKWSENADKTPKVNEGHAVYNKQSELTYDTMGKNNNSGGTINPITNKRPDRPVRLRSIQLELSITFKRPGGPNGSGEDRRHPNRVIDPFVLQRSGGPNKSDKAKKLSSEANKYSGENKRCNAIDVSSAINNKRKSALPMEDL